MSYRIEQSPTAGRYLVAARPIAAGAVVLEDEPYAAVIDDAHVALLCDHCFRPSDSLARCSKSKLARYCCREHQLAAWRAGFQQEAAALARLHPKVPPPTVRLAARAIWRHLRHEDAGGTSSSSGSRSSGGGDRWEAVLGLQDHWQQLGEEAKATYAQMAMVVREYLTAGSTPEVRLPEPRAVAGLLARCGANGHTICDDELRPLGAGLYPLAALANHSCRPSCMQSFRGGTIVFRALRPLAPGDEISISYIELAAPRRDRRQQLLGTYFFDIDRPTGRPPPAPPSAAPTSTSSTPEAAAAVQGHDSRQRQASAGGAQEVQPGARQQASTGGAQEVQPGAWQQASTGGAQEVQPGASQQASTGGAQEVQPGASQQASKGQGQQEAGGEAAAVVAPVAVRVLQPSGAVLRSYCCDASGQPPWPCDKADADATQLLLGGSYGASGGHGISAWPAASRPRVYGESEGKAEVEEGGGGGGIAVDYWGPAPLPPQGLVEAAAGTVVAALEAVVAAEKASVAGDHTAALRQARGALQLMDAPGAQLGQRHVLRMRANAAAMKAAIDAAGPWEAALEAALKLLPPFEMLYPQVWPNLGLHWALLAKLQSLLEDSQGALVACRNAHRCLSVTHPGTGVLQEVQALMVQLEVELAHAGQEY